MNAIYLDNNATTPLDPRVAERMMAAWQAAYANPASQHQAGRRARQTVEAARESIARILGGNIDSLAPDRLIFTSGGTEANNLVLSGLRSFANGSSHTADPAGETTASQVIVSSLEHPSIAQAADWLASQGEMVRRVRALSSGVIDLQHLAELLESPTRLVSIMAANNETGVIQPLAEIARLCSAAAVPLHTDAVQVVGKLPFDFHAQPLAAATIAAHKFHGPRGIGALLLDANVSLKPIFWGGFQQDGLRPGTESVELIVGMQAALEVWHAEASERQERLTRLRDTLEGRLTSQFPDLVVVGRESQRLPHTSNVALPGIDRQAAVIALDLAGVACSTGSACASGSSEPSPVLLAMGLPEPIIDGAIRFSLGAFHTESEVVAASDRIIKIFNELRRQSESRKSSPSSRQRPAKTL